ncbi:hypothetical protein WDU94_010699, partial [Cyamophila willieti]
HPPRGGKVTQVPSSSSSPPSTVGTLSRRAGDQSPRKTVNEESIRKKKIVTPPTLGGRGAAMLELLESNATGERGGSSSLLLKKRITPTRVSLGKVGSTPTQSSPNMESPKSSRRSSRMISLVKSFSRQSETDPAESGSSGVAMRASSPVVNTTPRETKWRHEHPWTPNRTPGSGILKIFSSGKKKLKVNFMENPVSEELHFDSTKETLNNSRHILYTSQHLVGKKLKFDPSEDIGDQLNDNEEGKGGVKDIETSEEKIRALESSIRTIDEELEKKKDARDNQTVSKQTDTMNKVDEFKTNVKEAEREFNKTKDVEKEANNAKDVVKEIEEVVENVTKNKDETIDQLNGSFEGANVDAVDMEEIQEKEIKPDALKKTSEDVATVDDRVEESKETKGVNVETSQETLETSQSVENETKNSLDDEYDEDFDSLVEEIEEIMDSQEKLDQTRSKTSTESSSAGISLNATYTLSDIDDSLAEEIELDEPKTNESGPNKQDTANTTLNEPNNMSNEESSCETADTANTTLNEFNGEIAESIETTRENINTNDLNNTSVSKTTVETTNEDVNTTFDIEDLTPDDLNEDKSTNQTEKEDEEEELNFRPMKRRLSGRFGNRTTDSFGQLGTAMDRPVPELDKDPVGVTDEPNSSSGHLATAMDRPVPKLNKDSAEVTDEPNTGEEKSLNDNTSDSNKLEPNIISKDINDAQVHTAACKSSKQVRVNVDNVEKTDETTTPTKPSPVKQRPITRQSPAKRSLDMENPEQSPVKESPVKQLFKDNPLKKTPVKEIPATQTPVKDSPVKHIPVKESPAKKTPVKEIPAPQTPVKDNSVKKTPVNKSPAKQPHVQESPAKKTPVKEIPATQTPAKDSPIKDIPIKDNSVKKTPVKSPAKQPHVQESPVKKTPANTPTADSPNKVSTRRSLLRQSETPESPPKDKVETLANDNNEIGPKSGTIETAGTRSLRKRTLSGGCLTLDLISSTNEVDSRSPRKKPKQDHYPTADIVEPKQIHIENEKESRVPTPTVTAAACQRKSTRKSVLVKLQPASSALENHPAPADVSDEPLFEDSQYKLASDDDSSRFVTSMDVSTLVADESQASLPPSGCGLSPPTPLGAPVSSSSHLYPPLINCRDPVSVILDMTKLGLREVVDSCFVKLGITTVGQLASLTRLQAKNLPLGLGIAGKVNKLVSALTKYNETLAAQRNEDGEGCVEEDNKDELDVEQELNEIENMEQEYNQLEQQMKQLRTRIWNKQRNLLKRKLETETN